MKDDNDHPKVALGVMIIKDGKVLLGKRKGSHGSGEYAFPGGHVEYMETFEDCIQRELQEECGLQVTNIELLFVTVLCQYTPKHYVHLGFSAEWKSGIPKVLEPEKCEGWDWYDIENLPDNLFSTIKTAIDSYKTGKCYYKEFEMIK
ncbi:MAG: NUDIX domain-containing protein [bacterium]